jgi:hypothetical protein
MQLRPNFEELIWIGVIFRFVRELSLLLLIVCVWRDGLARKGGRLFPHSSFLHSQDIQDATDNLNHALFTFILKCLDFSRVPVVPPLLRISTPLS